MVVKEKKLPMGNFFYLQIIAADFKSKSLQTKSKLELLSYI